MVELRGGVRWTSLTTTTLKIQYSMKVMEYIRTRHRSPAPRAWKCHWVWDTRIKRAGGVDNVSHDWTACEGSNFTTSTIHSVVRTVTEKM
jgi:hypothetical protein